MKIEVLNCIQCFYDNGRPSDKFFTQPLNDEGVFELKCEKGHETIILLQELKYEILFEIGIHALISGYPDAAATRFCVALERFYEFYLKVFLLEQGLPFKDFESFWNKISHQSERQLGAFLIGLYWDKSKHMNSELPEIIDDKAFRNRIIHQGYIPSAKEVHEYGKNIYNFVRILVNHLKANYYNGLTLAINAHLDIIKAAHKKKDIPIAILNMPTMLGFARTSILDFDDALNEAHSYSKYSIKT